MKKIIFSAALMFGGLTTSAQTTITFDSDDYKSISVYDSWTQSPFRLNQLEGNAGVVDNPDTNVDEVIGTAPNATKKVLAFQRSRYGSNAFGVRIDLKEPIRVTKQLQYIHVMTYLSDKPADSRFMVIGLGKRLESSWSWQDGEDEQFWAISKNDIEPKAGWQDIVVSFKGFSYSKEENANSGIDIYALVLVPDVRSPHADATDWVAYFDEIVVDNDPKKRFSTDKYSINFGKDAVPTRSDRGLNSVSLVSNSKTYTSAEFQNLVYNNLISKSVFSAEAGKAVQPKLNYSGAWMNAYVYVDWGKDGVFSYNVNSNGTPAEGSDIVSYNAAEVEGAWRKSDGSTVSNGNNIASGVPTFKVPANTANGFYRMRYKVDWNSLDPAGSETIISDGGGVADVILDVHGTEVIVNASQLNGDIVLNDANQTPLQNYVATYNQPLKVKVIPENGFVQNGFTIKYGYDVNNADQLDKNENPNWIMVQVPASAIASDGTYTIPAEYLRGGAVSIVGDMQQAQQFSVEVVGAPEGQGGIVKNGVEYKDNATFYASQYFSVDEITAIALDGYEATLSYDEASRIVTVTYKALQAYKQINSLNELSNDKVYHIKAKSGEGYWAWNSTISNTYVSLRGVTSASYQGFPSDTKAAEIYQEAITPFDLTVAWQIIQEDGSYYLYQPAKQQYVTRNGRDYVFTAKKTALDKIRNNGDGTFSIHAGGEYSESSTNFACICTGTSPQGIRNWTWDDHGSVLYLIENPNITLDDINTAIDELTATPHNESLNIYNLAGQKLQGLPNEGFVIVNGKKKIIRKK